MSVVGIDLGTTNTVAACLRSGRAHVLADDRGQRLLPSVVSFHPNGEVLVGSAARARRVIDPANTVYSHKRLIGRAWGSAEIAQAKRRFAFELREGPGQSPVVHARGQDYTLPEMSAFVLKRVRQIAEAALGTPVDRAVITVPAHFNELQRASTKVAGRVSGLEVLRILNEPTAAALAYGLGRAGNERVAVYDFGGGTFDCTLLDLSGNVFEVLATAGDSFLGGDDIDGLIAERMAESFLRAHRIDPRADAQMLERLKVAAEEIKIQLSTAETHTVVLKEVAHGLGGSSVHFTFTMSRRDLDAAITPLVDRAFKVTQDALALARLTPTSFDKVILVGGSTRIPLVRQRVEAFFGASPLDRLNPDEVVAIGAAIQAAALTEGQKRARIPAPPAAKAPARPQVGARPNPGRSTEPHSTASESFPSLAGAPGAPRVPSTIRSAMPSPIGEPEAFETDEYGRPHEPATSSSGVGAGIAPPSTTGPFGHIGDLSFDSAPDASGGGRGSVDELGRVQDLSTASSSVETKRSDAITKAPLDGPATDRTSSEEAVDLPSVLPTADLPAVARAKQALAERRRPPTSVPGMGPGGGASMLGRPPMPVAPQPFGPMERATDDAPRTAAMPGRAAPAAAPRGPAPPPPRGAGAAPRPPPPPNATAPMPTRRSAPSAQPPAPQGASSRPPAPGSPSAVPPPLAATLASPPMAPQRAHAPHGSAPAHAPFATSPRQAYPGAPHAGGSGAYRAMPAGPGAYGSQPPPPYGSQPPPPYGSQPPQAYGSRPPPAASGGYPSSPSAAPPGSPMVGAMSFDARSPRASVPPRPVGFAAPVLVDVTPRALLVETAGGYTDTIIPRNAKIPSERTRRFATGRDTQTTVRVRVAQGEHGVFAENTYLGEVELYGLRPAPRGEVVIAVTFEVDADGTLRVRARDVQTGQEARATLTLVGIADESSVVMMITRFAQQPVTGGPPGPAQ